MASNVHNIPLEPDFEKFLDKLVRSGRYGSEQEVFESALSLLQAQEEEEELPEDVEEVRVELDEAIGEYDRGEHVEFTADDVKREGRAELAGDKPSDA